MKKKQIIQRDYTKFMVPRQTNLFFDFDILIKQNEPVRLLNAILEELDYQELEHLYSSKGRKSKVPPHILFKIFIFAMSEGIFSTRKISRQCEVNIQYKWLLQGYSTPSHMTFQRFFARCTPEVLNHLFVQLIEVLERIDSITFEEVFIDGTKIEAYANRYSFVWKKNIVRGLKKLPDKLTALQEAIWEDVNIDTFNLNEAGLVKRLAFEIYTNQIIFVHGKGHRKTKLQRYYEQAVALLDKRQEYEKAMAILGDRNSYSKTDTTATFMRLKEDHMLNGQLKPAYNIQLAVHSEYILGVGVYPNPTDTKTLIPFLQQLEGMYKQPFKYIVADAGYDSNENFDWLESHQYYSCIKPRTHKQEKKRAWKQDISQARNMDYNTNTDTYTCAKGRTLRFICERKAKSHSGYGYVTRVYECENCNRCGLRSQCQKSRTGKKPKRNKQIHISPAYEASQIRNRERLESNFGKILRKNRSIQVEGVFGVLKEDINFRRLKHRGSESVHKFLILLATGFNLRKLHNRIQNGRLGKSLFLADIVA